MFDLFGDKERDRKDKNDESEASQSVDDLVNAFKSGEYSRAELRDMAQTALIGRKSVMNEDWCRFQYVCIKLGGCASHVDGRVYWVEG